MIGRVCIGLVIGLAVGIVAGGLMNPQQSSAQQPVPLEMRDVKVVSGEQMIDLTQRGPSGEVTFAVLDPDSKTVTVFRSNSPGTPFAPVGAPLRYGPEHSPGPTAPK